MIHSFAITNYLGDRIKLDLRKPEVSGFLIKSVTGTVSVDDAPRN